MTAYDPKRAFIIPTSFYLLRRTVIHSQFNVPPATLRKALKVVLFTQMRLPAAMFFWTSAFAFLFTVILPLKVSFSMTFAVPCSSTTRSPVNTVLAMTLATADAFLPISTNYPDPATNLIVQQ